MAGNNAEWSLPLSPETKKTSINNVPDIGVDFNYRGICLPLFPPRNRLFDAGATF